MSASPPDLSSLRIQRDEPRTRPARRGRWIAGALALVAILAVAGWLLRPRPLAVQVAGVALAGGATPGSGITANGYVVARTKASVAAKIPGRLDYLGVHEGSRVRRGEVIARLESGDVQAQLGAARADLAEIEAQLTQARNDLARAQRLSAQQVLSPSDLENAGTRVSVLTAQAGAARARVRLAEANLENTRVRAPFDGTVLNKDAEVGEIVAPASAGGGLTRTAIVTMADLRTLEVEVDVNEAYISQIRNGQGAGITLDAYPDTTFRGAVRQVVPTADRQKATVQVKVSILDRDPRILSEMGAKVVFATDAGRGGAPATVAPRVTVPAEAVVSAPDGARVWIVEGGRVSARTIEAGRVRDGQVEVRRGLAGGETVVLRPPATLREKLPVRVARP
jgi:RND family efflux transporter MFP subunit